MKKLIKGNQDLENRRNKIAKIYFINYKFTSLRKENRKWRDLSLVTRYKFFITNYTRTDGDY